MFFLEETDRDEPFRLDGPEYRIQSHSSGTPHRKEDHLLVEHLTWDEIMKCVNNMVLFVCHKQQGVTQWDDYRCPQNDLVSIFYPYDKEAGGEETHAQITCPCLCSVIRASKNVKPSIGTVYVLIKGNIVMSNLGRGYDIVDIYSTKEKAREHLSGEHEGMQGVLAKGGDRIDYQHDYAEILERTVK